MRDKTQHKTQAQAELAYVYHTSDPRSPYSALPEDQKQDVLIHDYIKKDLWEPDELITQAIEKYNLFLDNQSVRLLNSARNLADRLAKHLDTIQFGQPGPDGKLPDPTKIIDSLNDLPDLIKTLDNLKDQVEKQLMQSDMKVVGSKEFSTVFDD